MKRYNNCRSGCSLVRLCVTWRRLLPFFAVLFVQIFMGNAAPSDSKVASFRLCADAFEEDEHFLVVVDPKNKGYRFWFPYGDIYVESDINAQTFRITGNLTHNGDTENYLQIDATFSEIHGAEDCYCSSQSHMGPKFTFEKPKYKKVVKCSGKDYESRDKPEDEDLLFCPKCEKNVCDKASKLPGASSPVYNDWSFYKNVSGSFGGPGLEILREQIKTKWKKVDTSIDICTMDISMLPLPQLYCSNIHDPEGLNSYGYGANAKNFLCGFSAWVNCKEDRDAIASVSKASDAHFLDFNLKFKRCDDDSTNTPTSSPTNSPTLTPTNTPTLTPTRTPSGPPINFNNETCTNYILAPLDFANPDVNVSLNNLGGFCGKDAVDGVHCGDDLPKIIRYKNVGFFNGSFVTLVVENTSPYVPKDGTMGPTANTDGHYNNGVLGNLGQINQKIRNKVDLKFSWENSNGDPLSLSGYFIFYDIDNGYCNCTSVSNDCKKCHDCPGGRDKIDVTESDISVPDYGFYPGIVIDPETYLCQSVKNGKRSFWATRKGNYFEGEDNPEYWGGDIGILDELTSFQKRVTVALGFTDKSSLDITYEIVGGKYIDTGRNLVFSAAIYDCLTL